MRGLSFVKISVRGLRGRRCASKRFFSSENENTQQGCNTPHGANAPNNTTDVRRSLLESALRNVDTLGWTDMALAKAASDIGLTTLNHSLVARGAVELVEQFLMNKRVNVSHVMQSFLKDRKEKSDTCGQGESAQEVEILKKAIETHLHFLAPHRHSWPSALALLAAPHNVLSTLAYSRELADDLCTYIGVQSTRRDWYTERALVLSLYLSVELFFLTDQSEGLQDTKMFLGRALETFSSVRAATVR